MRLSAKLVLIVTIFTLITTSLAAIGVYLSLMLASHRQLSILGVSLLVTAVVVPPIVLILNRAIMGPIRALSAAVDRIALGDLSQPVPVLSQDELGILSQNFNDMTRQLSSTHRQLEATIQQAEQGQAQLASSINGLHQGFILVNTDNRINMMNAAAHDILVGRGGETKTRRHRLKLEDVIAALPKDLELGAKITRTLKHRRLAKYPDIPLRGRFLNLYVSPVLYDKQAIGCVLLLEDITEQRIMQRSRDEFFSIASHELRTPLTAIRGNTTMIQQYYPEILKTGPVRDMLSDIHESTIRLIEIVNDFLDTSRLEQNKMKFTPTVFELEPLIEKVIYELGGLSRDKNINLGFDQATLGNLPPIYADPSRTRQIIYNLIGNAMKFTDHGGVIVNCLVQKRFVKVCVTDTGKGISPDGQQILFHKFQQSTASTLTRDNTRGTGLGLYISKLMVEHMGGRIKLEHSEVGKGSTFSFTIPIATAAQIKAQTPVATHGA